jgi:hypothetical protein
MARIFTVDFEFNGGQHAALVAVRKFGEQAEQFEVSLRDETLYDLVPEGVVYFSISDENAASQPPARAELVLSLKKAVATYLKTFE